MVGIIGGLPGSAQDTMVVTMVVVVGALVMAAGVAAVTVVDGVAAVTVVDGAEVAVAADSVGEDAAAVEWEEAAVEEVVADAVEVADAVDAKYA